MSWHFFLTVAAGMFLVFAGQSNWKWFWNSHKQKGLIKLVGKRNAQIIAISCNSTNFWRAHSWDRLHIPKPFGTIHINFSAPMKIKESVNDIKNTDKLNDFLNDELDKLDRSF